MSAAEYLWAHIGPDAWLLVDGPSTATSGVIRAYLIGIEPDDWLWRGVGGEGRSASMDEAMVECQTSVILALEPDEPDDPDDPDTYDDLIDDLLDPDGPST